MLILEDILIILLQKVSLDNEGVIITICSTGKGAAIKLKELVEAVTKNIAAKNISIIPCGLNDLKELIKSLSKKSNIISLIGIENPNMGIPFISIEELIDGSGEEVLKSIIQGKAINITHKSENKIILKNLCKQTLIEIITFLNPEKIYPLLDDFVNSIEKSLETHYSNPAKLRIMFHVACALERMLLNNGLTYEDSNIKFDKKF